MKGVIFVFKTFRNGLDDFDLVPWKGYQSKAAGLIVCRIPKWQWPDEGQEGRWVPGKGWQNIHQPSGVTLGFRFRIRKDAGAAAAELASLTDWTQEVSRIWGLRDKVRGICNRYKEA